MATWVRIDLKKCFFGPLWSWLIRILGSYVIFTGFGEAVRLGGGLVGGWCWGGLFFTKLRIGRNRLDVSITSIKDAPYCDSLHPWLLHREFTWVHGHLYRNINNVNLIYTKVRDTHGWLSPSINLVEAIATSPDNDLVPHKLNFICYLENLHYGRLA